MKRILFIFLLMAVYVPANATIHVFTNDSLPKTLTAAYNGDTIQISGTHITTAASGINVVESTDGIYFDFGDDTLEFGTDGGDNCYGIYMNGSGTGSGRFRNHTIDGGHILRNVGPGLSDGSDNKCLIMKRGHNTTILGTNLTIDGHDAWCVQTEWLYDVDFIGGTWTSNSTSFTSRHNMDGCIMYNEWHCEDSGNYNYRLYGVTIANGPCQGIVVITSTAIIDSCTITVDHTNDYGSDANQYMVFLRMCYPGTQIINSQLISGTSRGGARGIALDNCEGTESKPIVIRDNTLTLNNGPDPENATGALRGIRVRAFAGNPPKTGHINIINNTITTTVDTLTSTTWIGDSAWAIQVALFNYDIGYLVIDSNTCYARALSGGTGGRAFQMSIEDTSIQGLNSRISNNKFYSCNNIVELHDCSNNMGCTASYFTDNTYSFIDTTVATGDPTNVVSNPKTWVIGCNAASSSVGNISIDGTYSNGASEDDINWNQTPATSSRDLTHRRTLDIYARGNNNLPVVNAVIAVVNDYGDTVASGNTNDGGCYTDSVSYWFESDVTADSTSFNDFTLVASYAGDSATNNTFTVGWTAAGGTDTLDLTSTVGTGEWGAEGEPAQIRKKIGNIKAGGAKL